MVAISAARIRRAASASRVSVSGFIATARIPATQTRSSRSSPRRRGALRRAGLWCDRMRPPDARQRKPVNSAEIHADLARPNDAPAAPFGQQRAPVRAQPGPTDRVLDVADPRNGKIGRRPHAASSEIPAAGVFMQAGTDTGAFLVQNLGDRTTLSGRSSTRSAIGTVPGFQLARVFDRRLENSTDHVNTGTNHHAAIGGFIKPVTQASRFSLSIARLLLLFQNGCVGICDGRGTCAPAAG